MTQCEKCGSKQNINEYWWLEWKNETWYLCDKCGDEEDQEKVNIIVPSEEHYNKFNLTLSELSLIDCHLRHTADRSAPYSKNILEWTKEMKTLLSSSPEERAKLTPCECGLYLKTE